MTDPKEIGHGPSGPDSERSKPRKRRLLVIGLLVTAALIFDLTRAPERQLAARGFLLAVDAYQATLSRAMPSLGVTCRFHPTCSQYTEQAVRNCGLAKGLRLGAWRILRCGPWTELGTDEPAPTCS